MKIRADQKNISTMGKVIGVRESSLTIYALRIIGCVSAVNKNVIYPIEISSGSHGLPRYRAVEAPHLDRGVKRETLLSFSHKARSSSLICCGIRTLTTT